LDENIQWGRENCVKYILICIRNKNKYIHVLYTEEIKAIEYVHQTVAYSCINIEFYVFGMSEGKKKLQPS
jgi:hypothetical protein